jgi:phage N-6-adenine-methyltransferase
VSELLPALPAPGEVVAPEVALAAERRVAETVEQLASIDDGVEWLAQAAALAAYLRDKDARGPMQGAQRRIEARIGELLGEAKRGHAMGHDSLRPDERLDFRKLAKGIRRGTLDYHDVADDSPWRASRRALLAGLADGSLDVHGSSKRHDWETPQALFDLLDGEFHFDLDVCATPETAKCERYFTPVEDGLAQEWTGVCWMNPPYGAAIVPWITKAHLTAQSGVCLVPARTDTVWWWEHCRYGEVRFLRGRLHFDEGGAAPFPSAVVSFGSVRAPTVVWWEAF